MSDITAPLSNTVIKKVTHLCDKGDAAFDAHEFVQAIEHYKAALDALPEPFIEYEISTFLTAGIGDAYFYLGKYEDALSFFDIALVTPDGLGNPFVQLRLGQCYLEVGDLAKAKTALTKAYDLEGESLFADDDPKYWAFLGK